MVNWSSPDIVAWQIEATDIQQSLQDKLGDRTWDYIRGSERWALEKKIGFALFGEPTIVSDDEKSLGYTTEKLTEIVHISSLVYECSGTADVHVAFLFVVGKIYDDKFIIPVIKVRTNIEPVFIDSLGRIYKSWSDFKTNNKLPKSLLCYPLNGEYQTDNENNVLIEFSTSPACQLGSRVCSTLDKVTTGVGLGATVIGLAGLVVTVAAPLALASTVGIAASGVYGLIRGSHHLHDRRTHNQSISLADSDARNCWLSVLGGAFGIGSALAISKAASIAASGGLLGRTSECIINFFNFGSLTVNGIGILNGLAYLVEKKQNNQLSALDVFQWSASIFFFYNAAVNIKTATGIVKDVQEGIKSDISSGLSKRRMKAFKRVMKESSAEAGTLEGNAKVIKGISQIGSKDEFFRLVIKGQQKFDKGIKFNQDGVLVTKGQLFFDTKAGVNYPINYKAGGNFFYLPGENLRCIAKLCNETVKLMETVTSEMGKNTIVINESVKFELTAELLSRLSQVIFRYSDANNNEREKREEISSLINQTESFAQDKGCSTETTLISYCEFICIYKKSKLKKMLRRYEEEKLEQIVWFDTFDEDEFNRKWGIKDTTRINEEFQKIINQEIETSNTSLKGEFDKYNGDVVILNESGEVKFQSCSVALVQFYRSFVIDLDEKLTPQEFFDTIRKTVADESLRIHNESESHGHVLYYDEQVPVVVEVQEINSSLFFVTTSFQDLNEPGKED